MNPVHNFPPCSLRYILVLSCDLCLGICNDLFPSDFPTKTSVADGFYMPPPISIDLVIIMIYVEEYKLWSSSYSFLWHITSSS
jgi:hypothetical protein